MKKITIQNSLEEQRRAKNLTQDELARRANVSVQTIQRIEKNKYEPSLALATLLANILEQEVTTLFFYN